MAQSMFCSSELEHETHNGPRLDNVIDKSIITMIDADTAIAGGHRERIGEVIANASHDIPNELGRYAETTDQGQPATKKPGLVLAWPLRPTTGSTQVLVASTEPREEKSTSLLSDHRRAPATTSRFAHPHKSDCNHQHPSPLTFWQSILSELQDWLAVNLHFPKTAWCNRIQVSGRHISQTVCFYSEFEYGTNQWPGEGGVNTCILLAIIKTHAAVAGCH
jgi:hypothetical protein